VITATHLTSSSRLGFCLCAVFPVVAALGLLGLVAAQPLRAYRLFPYVAYWALSVLFVVWLWLVVRRLASARVIPFLGRNKLGLSGAFVLTLLVFLALPPQQRILNDESIHLNVSRAMFEDQSAYNPLMGVWIDGRIEGFDYRLPKRPLLFPYVVHIVHHVLGYSERSAFFVNAVALGLLLFLVYSWTRDYLGKLAGLASMLLILSQPVVLFVATSAGFDLLVSLLYVVILVQVRAYLRNPSAPGLALLWVHLIAVALCRYESSVFALVCALVLLASRAVRFSDVRRLAPLYMLGCVLLALVPAQVLLASGKISERGYDDAPVARSGAGGAGELIEAPPAADMPARALLVAGRTSERGYDDAPIARFIAGGAGELVEAPPAAEMPAQAASVTRVTGMFHFDFVVPNLRNIGAAHLRLHSELPYAIALNWIGLAALVIWMLLVAGRWRTTPRSQQILLLVSSASIGSLFAVFLLYFGFRFDFPTSARLFLPFEVILSVAPLIALASLESHRGVVGTSLLGLAALSLVVHVPRSLDNRFFGSLHSAQAHHAFRRCLQPRSPEGLLLIARHPVQFSALGYAAISFQFAGQHLASGSNLVAQGHVKEILVLQEYHLSTRKPVAMDSLGRLQRDVKLLCETLTRTDQLLGVGRLDTESYSRTFCPCDARGARFDL
jgi:hypothetical protein